MIPSLVNFKFTKRTTALVVMEIGIHSTQKVEDCLQIGEDACRQHSNRISHIMFPPELLEGLDVGS